ncbi:MAG: protein kinase [Planctomycetes bacterium]|nr:protein kinase [Planctomycetota bacterium]
MTEDREHQETLPLSKSDANPAPGSASDQARAVKSALKGRFRLLVEKGRSKGRSLRLKPNGDVTVGREESNALTLSDAQASRKHFRVLSRLGEYTLSDLGSSNGTVVNGQRVTSHVLQPGDKIHVGDTWIFFLEEEAEGERRGALTGQEFNGYRVGRLLGRGGMGTVYEAQQISLERTVALKVLSPELARDPQFIERFLAEARAAGRLSNANIVAVFDVGQHEDLRFYSMEYMPGGSLDDLLRAKGPLPALETVPLIFDAARGLEYAERHGVIHRDIKPDNLMLGPNETVKICDLGIATFYDPDAQQEVSGSPHYIAPEHALGRPIDHRVDLYSLGVTWYELLCGEPPFAGPNAAEIIRKHVEEEPPSLRERVPDLPLEVEQLVSRLMAKDPEQRLPSARQLQVDLAAIARKLALRETVTLRLEAAAPNLPPSPGLASQRLRRKPRGYGLALAAGALILLSCLVASVAFAVSAYKEAERQRAARADEALAGLRELVERGDLEPAAAQAKELEASLRADGFGARADQARQVGLDAERRAATLDEEAAQAQLEEAQRLYARHKRLSDAPDDAELSRLNELLRQVQRLIDDHPQAKATQEARQLAAELEASLRALQQARVEREAEQVDAAEALKRKTRALELLLENEQRSDRFLTARAIVKDFSLTHGAVLPEGEAALNQVLRERAQALVERALASSQQIRRAAGGADALDEAERVIEALPDTGFPQLSARIDQERSALVALRQQLTQQAARERVERDRARVAEALAVIQPDLDRRRYREASHALREQRYELETAEAEERLKTRILRLRYAGEALRTLSRQLLSDTVRLRLPVRGVHRTVIALDLSKPAFELTPVGRKSVFLDLNDVEVKPELLLDAMTPAARSARAKVHLGCLALELGAPQRGKQLLLDAAATPDKLLKEEIERLLLDD